MNPDIRYAFRTFPTVIRDSLLRERLMATLSGFFGGLAVLLATIGLYGVIAYMVAQRTNEIGIRMALGAGHGDVLRLILREAGMLLAGGLVLGTVLALLAARAIESLLFGVHSNDPMTLVAAASALAAVALAASYLPARRAARLDPTVALRQD
jgi:ABC-type antimicrobial peptide transport system permease subunit